MHATSSRVTTAEAVTKIAEISCIHLPPVCSLAGRHASRSPASSVRRETSNAKNAESAGGAPLCIEKSRPRSESRRSTTPRPSVANLDSVLASNAQAGTWPPNLWLNASGMPVTPFTWADLEGLSQAIASRTKPEYQVLLSKIAEAMSATTVVAVEAVTW